MPDYREMYYCLFRAVSAAIEALDALNVGRCKDILIGAQQKTEEIYITSNGE